MELVATSRASLGELVNSFGDAIVAVIFQSEVHGTLFWRVLICNATQKVLCSQPFGKKLLYNGKHL